MALTDEQQQKDRSKSYGGSDFPKIMGDSKFGTPWDIVLEKSGVKPREQTENAYISFGNITESFVQEFMGTTNCDNKEFTCNDYELPLICHIDGIRQADAHAVLIEIKASSEDKEAVYNEYRSQIQVYMHAVGLKKAEFHLFQRTGKVKELFNKCTENMTSDWRMEYFNEEQQQEVEAKMLEEMQKFKIAKSHIKVKKVKYDVEYQLEINERVKLIDKYIDLIKFDPFHDIEELEKRFNEEVNGVHELVQYDTSVIEQLESQLAGMKELEKNLKEEKEKLLEFMQDNDIKQIDNDKFKITRKQGSVRKSFDKALYEMENGPIPDKYNKLSPVKESLLIKLK